MEFLLSDALKMLYRTPRILKVLLTDLNEGWTRNNEGGDSWSAFDVVGHLIHGEKTDWLVRAKIILGDGPKEFTPFDRFAQNELSQGKSLEQLLADFELFRTRNLEELRSLKLTESDMIKRGIHPEFGEVTLRQLLSTWVAHDLGHIYQISRVLAKNYQQEVGPWKKYLRVLND